MTGVDIKKYQIIVNAHSQEYGDRNKENVATTKTSIIRAKGHVQ